MKRTRLLLVAGVIAAGVVLGIAPAAPQPAQESSQIEQLRNEIAALRQRIEALEKRLPDHSIIIPRDNSRQGPIVIEPPSPARRDWRPFEFNGMQFYVVPLGNEQTRPASGP
ncbi:MAG: hypothetical protein KBE65_22495 [Phycisphaerae bacterium]|nr:hypothetical protein [Phycisphaerae bacterium]